MASVWGVSWGKAWGNSWGTVTSVRSTGGWVEWPGWRRQKELVRLKSELELTPEQRAAIEVITVRAVEGKTTQPQKALQTRLRADRQVFNDACYDLLQERIAYQRQEALRQEFLRLGTITAAAELRRQQELEDEEIVLRFLFELC